MEENSYRNSFEHQKEYISEKNDFDIYKNISSNRNGMIKNDINNNNIEKEDSINNKHKNMYNFNNNNVFNGMNMVIEEIKSIITDFCDYDSQDSEKVNIENIGNKCIKNKNNNIDIEIPSLFDKEILFIYHYFCGTSEKVLQDIFNYSKILSDDISNDFEIEKIIIFITNHTKTINEQIEKEKLLYSPLSQSFTKIIGVENIKKIISYSNNIDILEYETSSNFKEKISLLFSGLIKITTLPFTAITSISNHFCKSKRLQEIQMMKNDYLSPKNTNKIVIRFWGKYQSNFFMILKFPKSISGTNYEFDSFIIFIKENIKLKKYDIKLFHKSSIFGTQSDSSSSNLDLYNNNTSILNYISNVNTLKDQLTNQKYIPDKINNENKISKTKISSIKNFLQYIKQYKNIKESFFLSNKNLPHIPNLEDIMNNMNNKLAKEMKNKSNKLIDLSFSIDNAFLKKKSNFFLDKTLLSMSKETLSKYSKRINKTFSSASTISNTNKDNINGSIQNNNIVKDTDIVANDSIYTQEEYDEVKALTHLKLKKMYPEYEESYFILKKKVEEKYQSSKPYIDNNTLARYAKGFSGNTERAWNFLEDYIIFKEKYIPNTLGYSLSIIPPLIKDNLACLFGKDIFGRSIILTKAKHFFPKQIDKEAFVDYQFVFLEKSISVLPENIDKSILVVDFEGVGKSNFSIPHIKHTQENMNKYYVERMAHTVIINHGFFFSFVWKVVSGFLPEKVLKKIIILDKNNKPYVKKIFGQVYFDLGLK